MDSIDFGGDIKRWFIANYPDMMTRNSWGKAVMKKKYRGISDIISAYTDNEVNFGYFHNKDYWRKKNNKSREVIAQYGRMYYTNDDEVMDVLHKILPKTTSIINSKLGEVLKNVGR